MHQHAVVNVLVLLAAALPRAAGPTAHLWETALGTDHRLSKLPGPTLRPDPAPAPAPGHASLLLDPARQQQRIVGFGGAFTEAAAVAIDAAPPLLQQQVLEGYFGAAGLRYSLCRVHMGSCDYCEGSYSEDDTPGDWDLRHFNVSHDEGTLLPLIRRALAVRASWHREPFELLASPWSPPAWLKTNGKMSGKPWKKHKLSGATLLPDADGHSAAATWALYFSKFIDAYAARGVQIGYVSAQNEPTNFPCAWESCHFTPPTQARFIAEHLGPTLLAKNPTVKILALDDNKDPLDRWMGSIYNSAAGKFVAGAGLHWYTGDHFDAVAKLSAAHPSKLMLGTEACAGPGAATTDPVGWARAEAYGHDILGDLSAGAHGWIDWNMALRVENCTDVGQPHCVSDGGKHVGNCCTTGPNHVDDVGDDAPVIVDSVLGTVRRQPMFYYMGHFSKFLPPGSTRIAAELNATGAAASKCGGGAFGGPSSACLAAVGFVSSEDNATVAVLLNRGATAVEVNMQVGVGASASWVRASVPARAIQTVALSVGREERLSMLGRLARGVGG
jgi:glucosylceramidase